MILVIGPGHGAPAALASLWIEGSMERFYPGEYDRNRKGLGNLISRFSVPGGHPSHINAETPGAIHEGGELGYALAVSFGAVMDKPDLIVTCIVGDGEAETGPTAACVLAAVPCVSRGIRADVAIGHGIRSNSSTRRSQVP